MGDINRCCLRSGQPGILILTILAAGFLPLSCDSPGNGIFFHDGETALGISSLIVNPVRREYLVDSSFNKETDFSVLALYPNGASAEISPDAVAVAIGDQKVQEPILGNQYVFQVPGEKLVSVVYGGKSARYAVWVLSGREEPGPGGDLDGGGTTIIFEIH